MREIAANPNNWRQAHSAQTSESIGLLFSCAVCHKETITASAVIHCGVSEQVPTRDVALFLPVRYLEGLHSARANVIDTWSSDDSDVEFETYSPNFV
jgi:hypothetical protein